MDDNLVQRIAEHYYVNSSEYENLDECVSRIAEEGDLSSEG